jgi:transcriptional regulator with XRE-family HTH domain
VTESGEADRFQAYLRRRVTQLRQSGVSMADLSKQLGRHRSYLPGLLRGSPKRGIPPPSELYDLAKVLRVPFLELVAEAAGLSRAELSHEIGLWETSSEGFGDELSAGDWRDVREFIAYIRFRNSVTKSAD